MMGLAQAKISPSNWPMGAVYGSWCYLAVRISAPNPRSVTVWEGGRADNDVSLIITKDSTAERAGGKPKTDQSRVGVDFRECE